MFSSKLVDLLHVCYIHVPVCKYMSIYVQQWKIIMLHVCDIYVVLVKAAYQLFDSEGSLDF